ncbi:MAG: Crp/Fnr family transcriptional regulator [SAR202 cluster bacterium]|nr:Crp/Fnr family transcriptional regulator [SAR202 cluster bacterium]
MATPTDSQDSGTDDRLRPVRGQFLDAVVGHNLFAGLTGKNLAKLFPACLVDAYQDEAILCRCPAQFAHHDDFLVLNGTIAIELRRGPAEHVLELAGFGTVFNVDDILDLERQDIGARALGPTHLPMMDAEMLHQMSSQDPSIGFAVVRNLARLSLAQHRQYLERYIAD